MWKRFLRAPVDDYLDALESLRHHLAVALPVAVGVFLITWWVYVPVHELLHAFGCLATGGEVTRLEIDAIYGADFLRTLFPFVAVGSEYAGQLTGFDTHGNDAVYLATVFAPYLLTLFPGVMLLRSAGRERRPLRAAVDLGAAIPLAFAPAISLAGDYYEMGSILVSRIAVHVTPALPLGRWRSDDLFRLLEAIPGGPSAYDVAGIVASFGVGTVLAFATYGAGRAIDERCCARPPSEAPRGAGASTTGK